MWEEYEGSQPPPVNGAAAALGRLICRYRGGRRDVWDAQARAGGGMIRVAKASGTARVGSVRR